MQSNTITVIEKSDNSEYGGCELDGTYGVQYDDQAAGASDVGNTVVANAQQCNGGGLRLTAVGTGDSSSNNSYTGKLLSGAASGVAGNGLSIDSGGQPAFNVTRDTFIGDTSSIYVDWDGAGPLTCISCTLGSGPEPSNYTTFYFWNGGTSVTPGGLHFRDTTFTGSASKTSTSMTVPGNNGQTAEYWIDWTYTLTVEDGSRCGARRRLGFHQGRFGQQHLLRNDQLQRTNLRGGHRIPDAQQRHLSGSRNAYTGRGDHLGVRMHHPELQRNGFRNHERHPLAVRHLQQLENPNSLRGAAHPPRSGDSSPP